MATDALPLDAAFTYAQATALGACADEVRAWVRTGRLRRLSRGVFVDHDFWQGADDRIRHLTLAQTALHHGPPGAVLSHGSAARVHELEPLDPWKPEVPTLTATLARSARVPGTSRYQLHRAALPEAHLHHGGLLPVTAAARTVVDLARALPMAEGVVLADSALRLKLCSLDDLHQAYLDCQTWPGALSAGRAVFFADPLSESPLESLVRVRLQECSVPAPRLQVPLQVGEYTYRLDFLWEEHRTIGEADGLSKYDDPSVLRAEKLREDRLRDLGYEFVRITWQDIRADPDAVARRVWRAFGRAHQRM
ncbi:MAG TPA: DUF559 domain-containing protein [Frankiaceae bacterium]|nr:DUF559 domain-containing protein [Frankiaceae bacterium]